MARRARLRSSSAPGRPTAVLVLLRVERAQPEPEEGRRGVGFGLPEYLRLAQDPWRPDARHGLGGVRRARRRPIAELYTERFQLGTLFQLGISRSTLFCFRPSWIRYIDNSKRFGYKFEISLPAANETEPAKLACSCPVARSLP